jgi:hypothetical protein
MTAVPFKVLALWVLMACLGVLNGILREAVLAPLLGPALALPLSGITLSLFVFLLIWFALPWLGALRAPHYWGIGGLWLLLTILFEFAFGRLVSGKSWTALLQAYDVSRGNLWLLVLLAIVCSPYLAARMRGRL